MGETAGKAAANIVRLLRHERKTERQGRLRIDLAIIVEQEKI